jgi:hypothetical protein
MYVDSSFGTHTKKEKTTVIVHSAMAKTAEEKKKNKIKDGD